MQRPLSCGWRSSEYASLFEYHHYGCPMTTNGHTGAAGQNSRKLPKERHRRSPQDFTAAVRPAHRPPTTRFPAPPRSGFRRRAKRGAGLDSRHRRCRPAPHAHRPALHACRAKQVKNLFHTGKRETVASPERSSTTRPASSEQCKIKPFSAGGDAIDALHDPRYRQDARVCRNYHNFTVAPSASTAGTIKSERLDRGSQRSTAHETGARCPAYQRTTGRTPQKRNRRPCCI